MTRRKVNRSLSARINRGIGQNNRHMKASFARLILALPLQVLALPFQLFGAMRAAKETAAVQKRLEWELRTDFATLPVTELTAYYYEMLMWSFEQADKFDRYPDTEEEWFMTHEEDVLNILSGHSESVQLIELTFKDDTARARALALIELVYE